MDIHPPERPIHSVRDFLLQIVTITTGIVIALALEALLDWSHHRSLAHEARVNLALEIRDNKTRLEEIEKLLPTLEAALPLLAKADRPDDLDIHYKLTALTAASWRTAESTAALAYMPYDEVMSYATLYEIQQTLQRKLEALTDDMVQLATHITRDRKDGPHLDATDESKKLMTVTLKDVRSLGTLLQAAVPKYEELLTQGATQIAKRGR
jgi:hypothetical protein